MLVSHSKCSGKINIIVCVKDLKIWLKRYAGKAPEKGRKSTSTEKTRILCHKLSMCVCVCVCVCVSVCDCEHMYVHECEYASDREQVLQSCVQVCICMCVHTCMHARARVNVYVRAHVPPPSQFLATLSLTSGVQYSHRDSYRQTESHPLPLAGTPTRSFT